MWAGRVISISLLVCSQGVFMSGQFLSSSVSWEATKYIENNSVKNNFIFAFKLSCGPFRLYLYLLGALSPGWELTLCTVLNSDLPTVCCALTSRGLLKKVHSKHFCRHFIKHKKLDWGLRWQRKLFPSTGPHCCSLAWWILFRCLFFLQSQCHHYTSVVRSLPPQHLCTANSWMMKPRALWAHSHLFLLRLGLSSSWYQWLVSPVFHGSEWDTPLDKCVAWPQLSNQRCSSLLWCLVQYLKQQVTEGFGHVTVTCWCQVKEVKHVLSADASIRVDDLSTHIQELSLAQSRQPAAQ